MTGSGSDGDGDGDRLLFGGSSLLRREEMFIVGGEGVW